MGIASVVIAIVSFVSSVLLLVVAFAIASSSDVDGNEGSPITYVLGGWIFGTGVLSLTGIVFGIGGLLQKERRKKRAVVGLVANVALPIGLMFILVIAMTLAPPASRDGASPQYAAARNTNSLATAHNSTDDGPIPWKSPTARFFQLATAAMASVVVFFVQRKRHARSVPPADMKAATTSPCPRCGKPFAGSAEFCRRCGLARATAG